MSDFFTAKLLKELDSKPALQAMLEAQRESVAVGFEYKNLERMLEKLEEECAELVEAFHHRATNPAHYKEELGDLFFMLLKLCWQSGYDPDEVIHEATSKYLTRLKHLEEGLAAQNRTWADVSHDEQIALWRKAKEALKQPA